MTTPATSAERYQHALSLMPMVEALTDRGVALAALGRGDEALASFAEGEKVGPRYARLHEQWSRVLETAGRTSPYGLTGAVFARDREAIAEASRVLRYAAGNFYVNDKPTGAVVGQQPFGGGRASGTNDKAGSKLNLTRWVTARVVKETFVPPLDYTYPVMSGE